MRDRAAALPLRFVIALVGLAAGLRLLHLGRHSLWLDEAATWWSATRPTWAETIFGETFHGPLWWMLTRGWIGAFGDSEAALRFPAAIFGIAAVALCVPLFARLGRDLPRGAILLAVFLAAAGGFWIEYSQEARMYSALLAESIGLTLLLLRWRERGRARDAIGYGILATIALYTHFFAVWPLLAHAAWAVVVFLRSRRERPWRFALSLMAAQAMAVLLFLPWLARALAHPAGPVAGGRFDAVSRLVHSLWRIAVGPSLVAIDRPRVDAGLAALVRAEAPILITTALVWGVALVLGAWRLRRDAERFPLVATAILVPAVGILLLQLQVPRMHEKYLVFLAPTLVFLAATGARTAPGALRPLLTAGLVTIAVAGVAAYHLPSLAPVERLLVHGHPSGKEQWREVQADIALRGGAEACVVLYPSYLEAAWNYYDRGRHATITLVAVPPSADSLRRALPELTSAKHLFWIVAHDDDASRDRLWSIIATEAGVPAERVRGQAALYPRQWGIRVYAEDSPVRL